ncbi:MAG: glucuronate isomerase [Muribaculaceae bacterium]|nr:glucuronate isomerase [Muribaculaceae bacterium]
MKPFIHQNFLLSTETARMLYHEHASKLPIIDYHCHLSPAMIAADHRFADITELWLSGDHYKWRAMRANGVAERYITGDASPREKFRKWAETVPYTMRNPLYHWTAMELKTAFGIDTPLTPETADQIFDECNRQLALPDMTVRGLMKKYNVEVVCTTDDPIDTLEYHRQIAESGFEVKVFPAWRPDKAMAGAAPVVYNEYISKLSAASGIEIVDYLTLIDALQKRHDYFAQNGCSVADHGLSRVPWAPCDVEMANELFLKLLSGTALDAHETDMFNTRLLIDLCRMNARAGWVQQFHFGPMRNVNTRAFATLGPDTGFDTISDWKAAEAIASILNELDADNSLAKTILYNINPADNTWVAAMTANFQDGVTPGKIQMGAAWWFNDQLSGMRAQMDALSVQGLLSRFVGMLTDSRSFVSYTRHDYFRRLLCDMLGHDVEVGLIPESQIERVIGMVRDICYNNARNYFKF